FVAGDAEDPPRAPHEQGSREGQARHDRDAPDEEARHRDARARRRGALSLAAGLLHRRAEPGARGAAPRPSPPAAGRPGAAAQSRAPQTPPGSNSTASSPARRAPTTST